MVDFGTPVSQKLMDQNFTKISGLVDGCKSLCTSSSFFDFFKGRCQGNQLKLKNQHFPAPIYFVVHAQTDCNIAIAISKGSME